MYQNRIRRTSPNITPNSHPQFFVRRSEITFDERLPFIESVLETLLESRFGPGGVYQSVLRSSDRPELEPAVFFDLCDVEPDGLVPCYPLSLLGRKTYRVGESAYRKARQTALFNTTLNAYNSTAALTPNQGRGSP